MLLLSVAVKVKVQESKSDNKTSIKNTTNEVRTNY